MPKFPQQGVAELGHKAKSLAPRETIFSVPNSLCSAQAVMKETRCPEDPSASDVSVTQNSREPLPVWNGGRGEDHGLQPAPRLQPRRA